MKDTAPKPPGKVGKPTVFVGAWKALADAAGGVLKLAERLGRSRETLRHWADGTSEPVPEVQAAVGEVAVELGVDMPPFGAEAKRARGSAQ